MALFSFNILSASSYLSLSLLLYVSRPLFPYLVLSFIISSLAASIKKSLAFNVANKYEFISLSESPPITLFQASNSNVFLDFLNLGSSLKALYQKK